MNDIPYPASSTHFQGPGELSVYVGPLPEAKTDDALRDFPPGDPPQIVYDGVRFNYWIAMREGHMPFLAWRKTFSDTEMEWLRSIEPEVELAILSRNQASANRGA